MVPSDRPKKATRNRRRTATDAGEICEGLLGQPAFFTRVAHHPPEVFGFSPLVLQCAHRFVESAQKPPAKPIEKDLRAG
jgi:hypothetical protein